MFCSATEWSNFYCRNPHPVIACNCVSVCAFLSVHGISTTSHNGVAEDKMNQLCCTAFSVEQHPNIWEILYTYLFSLLELDERFETSLFLCVFIAEMFLGCVNLGLEMAQRPETEGTANLAPSNLPLTSWNLLCVSCPNNSSVAVQKQNSLPSVSQYITNN